MVPNAKYLKQKKALVNLNKSLVCLLCAWMFADEDHDDGGVMGGELGCSPNVRAVLMLPSMFRV